MIRLLRTNNSNPDFISLVSLLDADLAISDGDEHEFYDQYNKIDAIKHTLVAYLDGQPIGCGAIKQYNQDTMEVKRMFTVINVRGKGVASTILSELEKWAKELKNKRCILETGLKQPAAISLYKKTGYQVIANYGQYEGVANSVCFEKVL